MRKCLRYSCMMLSGLSLFIGIMAESDYALYLCGLFLLINNIIYCSEKIGERIVFLIFQLTFFVFLMGRPLIDMCNGEQFYKGERSDLVFALAGMALSLFSMFLGGMFADALQNRGPRPEKEKTEKTEYQIKFKENLMLVAEIVFYVTMAVYMMLQFEKLIGMHGKSYESYYTQFKSAFPFYVETFSSFMKPALCMFLATMPKKNKAFPALALFFLSEIPTLLIGMRNPIVLNALFIFLYYFIRDVLGDTKKWIGVVERTVLIIGTPGALLFLGAYNYIRAHSAVKTSSVFGILVDLIYKQGVSFWVLCIGHEAIPKLPSDTWHNYTFGGIIDYLGHGTIAQKLFGAADLGSGNSVIMATKSNSFAHAMSYVTRGKDYLNGQGWGSSYLLELCADYGYIGIIIANLILGFVLIYGIWLVRTNTLSFTIYLMSLTSIFFIPRAAVISWLEFIYTIRFWIPVVICYVGAGLCTRDYSWFTKLKLKKV